MRCALLTRRVDCSDAETVGLPRDERLREFLAELGEPIRFGVDDPFRLLFECGLPHVRSTSFERICASYTGPWERERAFRFQHVAIASRQALETPWG